MDVQIKVNEETIKIFYRILNHKSQTEIRCINPISREDIKIIFVSSEEEFQIKIKEIYEKYRDRYI